MDFNQKSLEFDINAFYYLVPKSDGFSSNILFTNMTSIVGHHDLVDAVLLRAGRHDPPSRPVQVFENRPHLKLLYIHLGIS